MGQFTPACSHKLTSPSCCQKRGSVCVIEPWKCFEIPVSLVSSLDSPRSADIFTYPWAHVEYSTEYSSRHTRLTRDRVLPNELSPKAPTLSSEQKVVLNSEGDVANRSQTGADQSEHSAPESSGRIGARPRFEAGLLG